MLCGSKEGAGVGEKNLNVGQQMDGVTGLSWRGKNRMVFLMGSNFFMARSAVRRLCRRQSRACA